MLDSHSITAAGNWQQVWKSKSTQISHPPVHQSKRKNAYVAGLPDGRDHGHFPVPKDKFNASRSSKVCYCYF